MRRIKTFGGQHHTLPIKDEKMLQNFMYHLLNKREKAKSEVKRYQADRNWMLCLIGFNTAFRAEDLLQLRVIDIKDGYVHIKENKTGKMQNLRMNKQLKYEINEYIQRNHLSDYEYMFLGQKKYQNGNAYALPITREQAYRIVSKTAKEVGISFTFGIHSLRKTFGYMYIKNGGKPETLMKMYNHDDYNVTMLYVCWGKDDAENDRESTFIGGVKK
jgi:integrase|uniref:Integrase n=1 Tax=Siphoviridae sp. ctGuJ10 TaxID=2825418 RepID=A0A8S5PU90_9CAUD|nr:MAG TPA: site specific tyrosine recombinase [Siphoviridae sp. ctGuJ10]